MILQHRKIRSRTRQTTRAVLVLATLVTLPTLAIAQEFSDAWLAQFPSVDSVYENIKGTDDLETATKQAAVFLILRNSVRESAPNEWSLSGEHQELFQIYQAEFKTIFDRAQVEYSDDKDQWLEFYRGHTGLARDKGFRLEVYEAIWPEIADAYRADLAVYNADYFKKGLYELATFGGVAVVALLLLVTIRRDFASSKLSNDGKLLVRRKKYQLYKVMGEVISAGKGSRTYVHGGGGTQGRSAPVTSTTYIDDNLILVDGDGKKHSIQLTDFDINTTNGNTITAIWAIKKGKERGPYIYIYDHDTRTPFTDDATLLKMHMPSWIWVVFPPIFAALAWGVLWEFFSISGDADIGAIAILIFSFLPTIMFRVLITKRKVHKLISSDAFQMYFREDVERAGGDVEQAGGIPA